MTVKRQADWDPRSEAVLEDQIAAYDEMRKHCPVARSDYGYASLFHHADVLRVVEDHVTFSNAVSRFPSVPNGMDPPEHTEFRRIIEPYFSEERMQDFEPACRQIAVDLAAQLPHNGDVEFMADFARVFAVKVQCAFLGWPVDLHEPLLQWSRKNHMATLSRDQDALNAVALEFDGYIREQLAARREASDQAPTDATTQLLHERVFDRPLTDDEIVSILRNWTVGELGTIAASVGIIAQYLAAKPAIQQQLRDDTTLLRAAIDEILRIHPPLIMNRRLVTREVDISGCPIQAGERVAVLWASANRDEAVFGDPDEFRLDRDPSLNLLYGAGVHVCPGAPLARLELEIIIKALLDATQHIALIPEQDPVKAFFPASGFSSLPLHIVKAPA